MKRTHSVFALALAAGLGGGQGLASSPLSGASALADGALFLPAPAQFRLGLRTRPAQTAEATPVFELDGQIVRDPNASGIAQASQTGVIEAAKGGLPGLGQRVTRGQVLAYLKPVLGALDRSRLEADLAAVDKDLSVNQKLLERVREQAVTGGINITVQQETLVIEYQGLDRRRAAIARALAGRRIALRAPVAGVVSDSTLALGKVAAAGEVLVEIVDPDRLRVEAWYPDLSLAGRILDASARGPDGRAHRLEFLGQGYQLRNQAVPLHFRLVAGAGLALGQSVRVSLRLGGATETGTAIPPDALLDPPGGTRAVWLKAGPERFEMRAVKVLGRNAGGDWVVSGVAVGERVVVAGRQALER